MNVLFASAYFYRLDPKQWKARQPYPPLGTLLAASVARRAGHTVHLFDTSLSEGPGELLPVLSHVRPDVVVVYDDGFNYLTKMCLTVMRQAAMDMLRNARKMSCRTIICSSDASDHAELYLAAGAEAVIRGEGEETLIELLEAFQQGTDLSSIQGVTFIGQDGIKANPARPVIRDLDSLPMPAWDLVKAEAYGEIWKGTGGRLSMNVATTRGCPFHCNWCAKPIYGNRYTSRSPGNVAEELEFLIKEYRVDYFWFCDDIFGLKPGWTQQFRDEITRRHLRFRFKIQSRADLLLHADTVIALAQAGAETVWIGAESGSQKILDAMEKGITVYQIEQATRLLRQHGIRVGFFLQFGYPGETKSDIDATIDMVMRLMPDEIGVSVSYPLPGTPFHARVKSELVNKQNWTDSDDLALMFRNTYSPAYYRLLHRYLHGRFRIQRGARRLKEWSGALTVSRGQSLKAIGSMVAYAPVTLMRHFQLKFMS